MMKDIEIAQQSKFKPITEIAKAAGLLPRPQPKEA
jgi:formyltetrahydrofolate synthetase